MALFDGIDMTDPCAVYPVLEGALNRLLAGENTVEIESETEVWQGRRRFQQSNIAELRRQVDDLRAQCRIKQGLSSGRHAIRGGIF